MWTGENGGFRKHLRHCSFACPNGNSYFLIPSMRSAERCENANVDVNTFMRFQETENGGFQKRISVDGASVLL